jgi:membrane protease YdiL (CAAX protease family)
MWEPDAWLECRSPRMNVAPFFALTLVFTLGLQLPAALAKAGIIATPFESLVPLAGLGGFGPLVAAIVFTVRDRDASLRALFGGLRPRSRWLAWYAGALVLPGALLVIGGAAFAAFGAWGDRSYLHLPTLPQHFVALALVPIVEEIGWRGFALPRLQRRYSRLTAALILGAVWAVWHVLMFYLAGLSVGAMGLGFLMILAGSVGMSWLYNRTDQHLLPMVLVHAGMHLFNSHRALPDDVTPALAHTLMWCVFAIVVLADRDAWRGAT